MKNNLSIKLSILLLALMPKIAFAYGLAWDEVGTAIMMFSFLSIFAVAGIIFPIAKVATDVKSTKAVIITIFIIVRIVFGFIGYTTGGSDFVIVDFLSIFVLSFIVSIITSIIMSAKKKNKDATIKELLGTSASDFVAIPNADIDTSKCIECGEPLTVNDYCCPKCKTFNNEFLTKGMFYTCAGCFAPVRYDQAFCTACGTNLNGAGGKNINYFNEETRHLLFKPYGCKSCGNQIDDLVHECSKCHQINNKYIGPVPRLICSKCGNKMTESQDFCTKCGAAATDFRIKQSDYLIQRKIVLTSEVDSSYFLPDDMYLDLFIKKELKKYNIDDKGMLPRKVVTRKKILKVLLAILMISFTTLLFFHRHIALYIALIAAMLILFLYTRRYSTTKYIAKELMARPTEKMSNVILGIKNDLVKDNSNVVLIVGLILAILIPSIVFFNPRAIYEPNGDGVALRFYTYGIVGNGKAVIPEEVDGKKVTSIRGDVFANLYLLREVELPETIEEIRGGAFTNDISLVKINLPSKSTEIKGNTFENCSSLRSISIPDSVTRIGGHAFYGNSSLSEVIISENSQLKEIGSSAFRQCSSLYSIKIPYGVYVNERAFKESPTNIIHYESADNPGQDNSWNNSYTIPEDLYE